MEPISEDIVDLNQAEELRQTISKRDRQIHELEERFGLESNKSKRLSQLLEEEEQKNKDGNDSIRNLTERLEESNDLICELKEKLGGSPEKEHEDQFKDLQARIAVSDKAIKNVENEINEWKAKCQDLEKSLDAERDKVDQEKREHEQVKFKLSQSEELLRSFRETNPLLQSDDRVVDEDERYQNIIQGLKASIDIQSERNIELHQQLQQFKKDSNDAEKLTKTLQDEVEKDKKLIDELNAQNSREYQRNEKLRTDIQRLKRDIDSWKKIQADMKSQYQELRLMYDGVCKHADDQKKEMLEMKMVNDRDKRAISRHKDDVEKLRIRSTSLKQTYEDLKEKYDENAKVLEDIKVENRVLSGQLQNSKRTILDLSSSNKDLKKRAEFNHKELMEKHRVLLQSEEKLKDIESLLEEKEVAVEEAKVTVKEANEKAEKRGQEAINKERDLMDRITLVQDLQNQIQSLDDSIKTQIEDEGRLKKAISEKDKAMEEQKKITKEKEFIINELEQRVLDLEKNAKQLEGFLESVKRDLEKKELESKEKENVIVMYQHQLSIKDENEADNLKRLKQAEEELDMKNEGSPNDDLISEKIERLSKTLHDLKCERNVKNDHISKLTQELEEEQKRTSLQEELLKEFEEKIKSEDHKLNHYEEKFGKYEQEIRDLQTDLTEKDRLVEELKRELEESEVIQVYLNEISALNKTISDERNLNEQLRQKLENNSSEEASRIEEEKKEVMLQMTKELKREKLSKQTLIADLKEDIRVLEYNVENEKERSRMLSKEVETTQKKLKNDRESFLEHIEELQGLYSSEKKNRLQAEEKASNLMKQVRETERHHVNLLQEIENTKVEILTETQSAPSLFDHKDGIEDLKQELVITRDHLREANQRIRKADKERENEKLDFQILCSEKDELISSLRKENLDLKKGWQKESEWMDENTLEQSSEQSDLTQRNSSELDENDVLVSQNEAIQVIKKKIEVDFNLNHVLPLTEQSDEKRLDILYKKSLTTIPNVSKKEALRIILEKVFIVLLMSPLAYLLCSEMPLSIAAILMPLAFVVYHRPWKSEFEIEKILTEAVNGLSTSLAAERAENENLRRIVDDLKRREYSVYNFQMSSGLKRKSFGQINEHFSNERKVLTEGLERDYQDEQERRSEELLQIKEKSEVDRLKLQRQQSFIDKLEVILHEKEIKSGLGKFWGYEELKMAINRLKHEREIDKNRSQSSDDDIAKKISGVLGVASSQPTGRKLEVLVIVILISAIVMLLFSADVSSFVTMAVMIIISSGSLIFGLNTWKSIKNVRDDLIIEKGVVDAQKVEIDELSVILDREHDVVNKQKQAIEALEERLNDEYRKNKENQVTIAKLTWICQESEQIQSLKEPLKDPDLQKIASEHARDKVSVFRTMQKQLKEHNAYTEEQRKAINDLKKATTAIVEAAEKQISLVKSPKETRKRQSTSLLGQGSVWQMVVLILLSLITALMADLKSALTVTLVSAVMIGFGYLLRHQKSTVEPMNNEKRSPQVDKANINLPFSFFKLCLIDGVFIIGLVYLNMNTSLFKSHKIASYLAFMVFLRLLAHFLYKRTMRSEWKDVLDDLGNQVNERTELIDIQTQEIQTLKTLLEVERGYSRQADKLLKESKVVNDEGFEEFADGERLKRKASYAESEDDRLVNYELDELKIFFEEEQRANVQLRKCLAEVEESKRKLINEATNLKRKLEIEQIQRKDIKVSKEEELFLKDRIDELMEDLEAEQRTKQELNAQLIEERSSRELKEIELHDLKEKFRDEKHANQNLRQQVSRGQNDPENLRRELLALHNELEEERLSTQRHNIAITEAFHEIREKNLVLRREIDDSKSNDSAFLSHVRAQTDDQQEAIERIQTMLHGLSGSSKALKYQDILDELQDLRHKLAVSDIKPNALLDNLELEREKNKILEEAVEELQRQQVDQRKMFEEERRRSIEMARQLSGEDIPMTLEEEETNQELEEKRGVLYWLGTNGGLTDWKNPGESGLILINRSSYGHGRATDVANRRPSWCSTSNKPNQWWKIDFGEKRLVVPNAYSLRHGWSGNAGALRNWVFEGSTDGKKWITLRQHINDETIDKAYGFGYWKINNEDEKSFRFVRVRQTGLNSNGRHALRLCGIEVYGRLVLE